MQISREGPAFGKMQMVVGRGENREGEFVGQTWRAGDSGGSKACQGPLYSR